MKPELDSQATAPPSPRTQRKPASIWIGQALLAINFVAGTVRTFHSLRSGAVPSALSVALMIAFALLIFVAQYRRPSARWVFGLGVACLCVYSASHTWPRALAKAQHPELAEPGELGGMVIAMTVATTFFAVLTVRLLFGSSAKDYFQHRE